MGSQFMLWKERDISTEPSSQLSPNPTQIHNSFTINFLHALFQMPFKYYLSIMNYRY